MTTTPTPRPQKVTMACLFVGLGALLILGSVFVTLSDWGSLDVRKQVQSVLDREPLRGADLAVDQVLGWLRLVLMGVAAAAVATVVLAIYTAQRHRGARTALTILAGVSSFAFLAGGLAGILPAAMSLLCVFYLWSAESRAWFAPEGTATKPGAAATPTPEATQAPTWAPPPPLTDPTPSDEAAAPEPSTAPGPAPASSPFAQALPATPSPYAQTPPYPGVRARVPLAPPRGRPRSIVIAVAVTSVMAGLVALMCAVNAITYAVSPDKYARLIAEQPMLKSAGTLDQLGMTASELSHWMFIATTSLTILSALAIGASLLMLLRLPVARVLFTIVTGVAIVVSVVLFPLGWVWAVGEIFVLVQVYRVDANEWFRARR